MTHVLRDVTNREKAPYGALIHLMSLCFRSVLKDVCLLEKDACLTRLGLSFCRRLLLATSLALARVIFYYTPVFVLLVVRSLRRKT